jgi:transcriptional regulator with XRE-family HTH domain
MIGWNIKELRQAAGLSLKDAAVLMTIWQNEPWSHQKVYTRELGRQPVTVTELHTFADLFGVPIFRLLHPPAGLKILNMHMFPIAAGRYQLDYFYDTGGRTGLAFRVALEGRKDIVARKVARSAERGEVFAPGFFDDPKPEDERGPIRGPADGPLAGLDLKSLAKELKSFAEARRQVSREKKHGDHQED